MIQNLNKEKAFKNKKMKVILFSEIINIKQLLFFKLDNFIYI